MSSLYGELCFQHLDGTSHFLLGSPSKEKQVDVIWIITALVTSYEQKDLYGVYAEPFKKRWDNPFTQR